MADVILNNCRFLSDSGYAGSPQSLGIHNGIILPPNVLPSRNRETRVYDCGGALVVPGFINAHSHIGTFGALAGRLSLSGANSRHEICQKIGAALPISSGSTLVTTPIGTSPYYLDLVPDNYESWVPTREDLDKVAPYVPVVITAPDNKVPNTTVLNSEALRRIGWLEKQPAQVRDRNEFGELFVDLDGIQLCIDDQGIPTGRLHGAQSLYNGSSYYCELASLLESENKISLQEGIKQSIEERLRYGVTCVVENHMTTIDELAAYQALRSPLRIAYAYNIDTSSTLKEIRGIFEYLRFMQEHPVIDNRISYIGVGVDIDGAHSSGKAFSADPYIGPTGQMINSEPLVSSDKYYRIVRMAAEFGLRVHSCAAGRGAIGLALDAFERVQEDIKIDSRRWVLEHVLFPTEDQIRRAAQLRLAITTSTNFLWGQFSTVWEPRLGRNYADFGIPASTWLAHGIHLCQTTDWGPQDLMFTLWESVARLDGATSLETTIGERVSPIEGLKMLTEYPAWLLFQENTLGQIKDGYVADLTLLSDDPSDIPVDSIRDINVLGTFIDGDECFLDTDAIHRA